MYILPSQTQGSTSSSSLSALSLNPNSRHGNPLHPPPSASCLSSISPQVQAFQTLHLSDFRPSLVVPDNNSGPSTQTTEDSGGPSSKKVTDLGSQSGMKALPHQNSRTHSRSHSGRQAAGSSRSAGKTKGTVTSSGSQQNTACINSHGSTLQQEGSLRL